MSRYKVKPMPPNGATFGIYDEVLGDWCGLPVRRERGEPSWWLEWGTRKRAQAWLDFCLATWREWPQQYAPPGYGRREPAPAPPKRGRGTRKGTRKTAAKRPRQSG
ncbi:hypothetical protein [Streptomyces sp. NPDC088801]|uniref:hypothetical protein n=1 Tax=Streptomyces sp. NPDC088801 TaxID=3365903 RepID=UPI0037F8B946